MELARKLSDQSFDCKPGWQLCRQCYRNAEGEESVEIHDFSTTTMDIDISDIESTVTRDQSRAIINDSFEAIGVSREA